MSRIVRAVALAAAGAAVVGGTVLGIAPPAQAHNYLVSSTPAAGEVLTALPELFEITTNEALLDSVGSGGFALEVLDGSGLYYGDGCVSIADTTMTTAAELGAPGTYTVVWQVVSGDGHTVSEQFDFIWAPTDATTAVSSGSTSPPLCDGDTDAGTPQTTAEPGDGPPTDASVDLSNVLWIGGAVVLVGLTVGITLLLSGRKKK